MEEIFMFPNGKKSSSYDKLKNFITLIKSSKIEERL